MPNFKSKAQVRAVFAKDPKLGRDMADYSKAHGISLKKLPERIHPALKQAAASHRKYFGT